MKAFRGKTPVRNPVAFLNSCTVKVIAEKQLKCICCQIEHGIGIREQKMYCDGQCKLVSPFWERVGYPQESEICGDSTECSLRGVPSPRHPTRCFILHKVLSAESPWSFSCPSALKSTCLFGNCCPKYTQILPSRSSPRKGPLR